MPVDYRYDPFSNTKQPVVITNEKCTIPLASPFTIRLMEVPLKETPSSLTMRVVDSLGAAITSNTQTSITVAHGSWFSIGNVITIDSEKMQVTAISSNTLTVIRGYDSSTATTHTLGVDVFIENSMAEVSATPTAGQYWPDYSTKADGDSDWNTGTILFNSADGGKQIAVSYKGMGSLADWRAVNHGKQLFTSSGTFTVPPNVTKVWITGCGGGGGGGGDRGSGGGGGGGGGCVIAKELTVTPGVTINVTIGLGGKGGGSSDNGTAGGATSFGSLHTCPGGGHGISSISGGGGGAAGGLGAQSGGGGGGGGGGTIFGAGNSTAYGSGGAGGAKNSNSGGESGAQGFLVVEW